MSILQLIKKQRLFLSGIDRIHVKGVMKKKKAGIKPTAEKESKLSSMRMSISREEYDLLRQHIISIIWKHNEVAYAQLLSDLEENIAARFRGDISVHAENVLSDLEVKGVIEKINRNKMQYLRLKHSTEKQE